MLAGLPMGKLLGTLDVLEQRGRLSETCRSSERRRRRRGRPDPTALLARELASMSLPAAQGAPLDTLAVASSAMPAGRAVRRVSLRHRAPPTLARPRVLLEGALAMQSALVTQREPVPDAPGATGATGAMAGTAMPAPIEPLPWTPPGNSRPRCIAATRRTRRSRCTTEKAHPGETIQQ